MIRNHVVNATSALFLKHQITSLQPKFVNVSAKEKRHF